MLRDREHVAGAGVLKDPDPFLRVKVFRPEQGNKILISEPAVRPIGLYVMIEFIGTPDVHGAWIPFIRVSRYAVYPPVDKDPQPPLIEPVRDLRISHFSPPWDFI